MTIVVKCTITVYFLICSLSKNRFPLLSFQIGMKLSSLCSLHTMIWPQSLWFSMHLNLFKVGFSIMVGSKAYMVLRMPILSGNHEIKFMLYAIDYWYYFICIGNSKRSARHKVVLYINYKEGFHSCLFLLIILV